MLEYIIKTIGLRKQYGANAVLRGIDFSLEAGSICGLLGRNGSGKSTFFRVLIGMVRPSGGSAKIFGLDVALPAESVLIRKRAMFVPDERQFYPYMTAGQVLAFSRGLYPGWNEDLEAKYRLLFDLPLSRKVDRLSKGERTKLALLIAFSCGAKLLLLDEPTEGLDACAVIEVQMACAVHAARGGTLLISTHQLEDMEQVLDSVRIIDKGRILLSGSMDDLREQYCRVDLLFQGAPPAIPLQHESVVNIRRFDRGLSVIMSRQDQTVLCDFARLKPLSLEIEKVSLKEIFIECVSSANARTPGGKT